MSLLPARRGSLCVFCVWAALPPPRPATGLPRIQAAYRSTRSNGRKKTPSSPYQIKGLFQHNQKKQSARQVYDRLAKLKPVLQKLLVRDSLGPSADSFEKAWYAFECDVDCWISEAPPELNQLAKQDRSGKDTLAKRLQSRFYNELFSTGLTSAEITNQKRCADLRFPAEWYPATRELQRTIHLHVGPTNSGKTYHALKRLEEAGRGIYLGPLRLLAHEVYTRLNAKGRACALVTGEEQRIPRGSPPTMFSCTVEMAPLNTRFDVAVIDEIQMISNPERGWAWSQAFLGIQAREIHLCGEARTVAIIRQLAGLTGDKVVVHEYKRLTPLNVAPTSLEGDLRKLEKGDCIVSFTILKIHELRKLIEKRTNKNCAIVYGRLPPETRAQQARLFNDPDNDYDYLVASDAIGMGLNLAVKRVIFHTTQKSNGVETIHLPLSDLKQIAGRAGRFKTAHQATTSDAAAASNSVVDMDDVKKLDSPAQETVGCVTTYRPEDFSYLKKNLSKELKDIKTARIFPPTLIIERFASYFPPGTPFSYIISRLHTVSELHPRFEFCELNDQLGIADVIHSVKNLSIQERLTFCAAPINLRDKDDSAFLRSLAECVAQNRTAPLLDLEPLPLKNMDAKLKDPHQYLHSLERLHKMLITYLWLSYRFPHIVISRRLANYCKKLVEDQIERTLASCSAARVSNMNEKIETARQDESDQATIQQDDPIEVPTQRVPS